MVLCFPWSITFIQPGVRWSILSGAATSPSNNRRASRSSFGSRMGPSGPVCLAGRSSALGFSCCSSVATSASPWAVR